jgi:hemoglobin
MKQEILTAEHVKTLVDKFYEKVNADKLLSPVFNEEAKVDWPAHLPKMYKFWGSILLGTAEYNGRPFPPHTKLNIGKDHFGKWIELFYQTVDENFEGAVAEEAKLRAQTIASVFQYKLGLINS